MQESHTRVCCRKATHELSVKSDIVNLVHFIEKTLWGGGGGGGQCKDEKKIKMCIHHAQSSIQ